VSSSETLSAIAIAPGDSVSAVESANYTIAAAITPIVNFPAGFVAGGLHLNGSASLKGTALQLTNGGVGEAGSAFYPKPVSINQFETDFDFQLPSSNADGFTFTIQNASTGAASLGTIGAGLGYGGIGKSAALAFDFYQVGVINAGIAPSGLNLHSGDPFHVHMTYSGGVLTLILTDLTTGISQGGPVDVNLPEIVGSSTAYVGFTGGTGALTSIQDILNWTFEN
jgi:hypothetical protein